MEYKLKDSKAWQGTVCRNSGKSEMYTCLLVWSLYILMCDQFGSTKVHLLGGPCF